MKQFFSKFLCREVLCEICKRGGIYIFFLLLKKSANFLQLSAKPETSSITIRGGLITFFSPYIESILSLSSELSVRSLNSSISSLKESTSCR